MKTLALALALKLLAGCTGGTETNVTPAPCDRDSDCPDGVRCLHLHDDETGEEGPGFCDVREHEASRSAETPAPCDVDADCGAGVCLHRHDDAGADIGGFCQLDSVACPRFCDTADESDATVCQDDADCGESTCGAESSCAY